MKRIYELSSEEVVQICTVLEFYIRNHEQVKDILLRSDRVVSDEEVQLYQHCTKEIEESKKIYNKFRQN